MEIKGFSQCIAANKQQACGLAAAASCGMVAACEFFICKLVLLLLVAATLRLLVAATLRLLVAASLRLLVAAKLQLIVCCNLAACAFLYPRHLCEGVYSFLFSVRPFVCSFVRLFVRTSFRRVEFTSKFCVKVSQVVYISATTHQKAFIFGP